jgi:hypothetical protein
MRCAAQHEVAFGRGDEYVLAEQPADDRFGVQKPAELQPRRDRAELFIADRAQARRIDSASRPRTS